jgi:hypothetical protein
MTAPFTTPHTANTPRNLSSAPAVALAFSGSARSQLGARFVAKYVPASTQKPTN